MAEPFIEVPDVNVPTAEEINDRLRQLNTQLNELVARVARLEERVGAPRSLP